MKLKKEIVFFVFNMGGLGDLISRLSAVKYCINNYPWVDLGLIVPMFSVELIRNVFPFKDYPRLSIQDVENYIKPKTPVNTIYTDNDPINTILRQNLTLQGFSSLLDYYPEPGPAYDYVKTNLIDISKFNLPKDYIVITSNYTSAVREFSPEVVNQIVDYIKSLNLDVVFLGKSLAKASNNYSIEGKTNIDLKRGINLLDRTSLIEAASIMNNAKAVLGLDNGLLHLAATTNAKIIYGFTTVEPHQRIPQRNGVLGQDIKVIVPPESLHCRFCQSKLNFVYNFDFKNCYHNTFNCIRKQTDKPWINAINDILNNNWENNLYEDVY